MDLRQLEYITAIEDFGNMTEAAAHLYVTPSALNQQLLKLEKSIGMPLFVRGHRFMMPTPAGRIWIDSAREILRVRRNTYTALSDLAGNYRAEYHLGLAYGHGNDALLHSYSAFHGRYPGIVLLCRENMVANQMEELKNGSLDIGMVHITDAAEQAPDFHYELLSAENLVLGVPVSHPAAAYGSREPGVLPTADLSLLREESFALMQRGSTQRARLDPLFVGAGFTPQIIAESTQNRFLQSLAASQGCCTIIPQAYATDFERLAWFALPTHPRFILYAIYLQGLHLPQPMRELLGMIRSYAQEHFQFPEPAA